MNLEEIRQEIDQVDAQLVALLEKRMDLVSQVVAYKQASGKAVLDSKREEVIFAKVAERVSNPDYRETIVSSFADLLKQSRAYQEKKLS